LPKKIIFFDNFPRSARSPRERLAQLGQNAMVYFNQYIVMRYGGKMAGAAQPWRARRQGGTPGQAR
jgi:hypothetical protein